MGIRRTAQTGHGDTIGTLNRHDHAVGRDGGDKNGDSEETHLEGLESF